MADTNETKSLTPDEQAVEHLETAIRAREGRGFTKESDPIIKRKMSQILKIQNGSKLAASKAEIAAK